MHATTLYALCMMQNDDGAKVNEINVGTTSFQQSQLQP